MEHHILSACDPKSYWHHHIRTSSNGRLFTLLALLDSPHKQTLMWIFVVSLSNHLDNHWWYQWSETPWCSFATWRHCNDIGLLTPILIWSHFLAPNICHPLQAAIWHHGEEGSFKWRDCINRKKWQDMRPPIHWSSKSLPRHTFSCNLIDEIMLMTVQDCGISKAIKVLQCCTLPSISSS